MVHFLLLPVLSFLASLPFLALHLLFAPVPLILPLLALVLFLVLRKGGLGARNSARARC